MNIYDLVLDDGLNLEITADFVDVLDGPSHCVRFVRTLTEDDAFVYAVYFGVACVRFLRLADAPVKRTKKQVAKKEK